MAITRVRGTEDVLNLRLHNFVLQSIKKHLQHYNFIEVETPILEYTNLFIHALGSETDVVSKEMYVFKAEESEHSICLRPEATASMIRAYVENNVEQTPWKAFIFGPMFRHERPQKGRWRQFHQVSIEIIGSESMAQDALFIKMLDSLYSEIFKLENYVIKLNFLGCLEDRKQHRNALVEFLNKSMASLCQTCLIRKDKNPLRVFDCKSEQCQAIFKSAPKLIDYLCSSCNEEWKILQDFLQILSINFVIDPFLVRGLDYYNKTVFEFSSRELGAQNAFCGGGRYSLGKDAGAKHDFPSIGVGIGFGRLLLLVEKNINKLLLPQDPALSVIIPFSSEQYPLALLLASDLTRKGICVDCLFDTASLTNMMKKANKMGAKFVLLLGSDEQKNGTVAIKNMSNGQMTTVKQTEAYKSL
jgi:histidyl-tRNA synthetase